MLHEAYTRPPLVRANLVQSLNGAFIDENGSSRGLSNSEDLQRLLALRGIADVVVTDGETARKERYKIPSAADLAVFSRRGFQPSSGNSKHRYLHLDLAPASSVKHLLELGYSRILLECGPGPLRQIITGARLDELCLTTTCGAFPQLAGIGIRSANVKFVEQTGNTTFWIFDQIQGFETP